MKDCLPWEGAHAGAEEKHNEEGASEASVMNGPQPSFHILLHYLMRGSRRIMSEVEPAEGGSDRVVGGHLEASQGQRITTKKLF